MAIPRKTTKKTTAKTPKTAAKPAKTVENSIKNTEINPNLFSITALSKKFILDRATIRERLERAEIKPVSVKSNEKLYLLEDVEIILAQSELNEAKLRKIDAEAELKELEVKKKLGEYGSVAEFTEIVLKIFSQLYKKTVIQMPNRIASKLHNANSSADVATILKQEAGKEFEAVRENFENYLGLK